MTDPAAERGLVVRNLCVCYPQDRGTVQALRNVSFTMGRERVGVVGESGSGKSTLGRAIMGLIRHPGVVTADTLRLGQVDLSALDEAGFRLMRGRRVAMVLQDPRHSLNPVMTVGRQLTETHRHHFRSTRAAARRAALTLLEEVHINDPERVFDLYPHQISGGMGQRVMIACMLIADPDVLIADEPTSALDSAVQQQVLAILDRLVSARGMGLLLISHDLRLVGSFCDRVVVMYGGRIVETLGAGDLSRATHPYTQGLLAALPDLRHRRETLPQLQRDPAWLAAP